MEPYHQLTREQRYQIFALLKIGHSYAEVATVSGVHKSTVSREVRRNRGGKGYRPRQAHERALERRSKATPRIGTKTWALVEKLLWQEWSPEQISGRLKDERKIELSHEWIYQHVRANKCAGGDLYRHLRCQKAHRKRYGTYSRRGKLPNCRSIEERPAVVNQCKRLGNWEVDTMFGKDQSQALVTLTERKSRFTLLGKVSQHSAQAVQDQIQRLLLPVRDKVHTLTSDHGREFANHQQMAKCLQLKYCFAHPYAA